MAYEWCFFRISLLVGRSDTATVFFPHFFARGEGYTAKVFFPHFFARAKKRSQRKHAKGEIGVIRRTKAELLSLLINPYPFGIPLTPSWQNGVAQSTEILCGRAKLLRRPCRGCWPKAEQGAILFRGERGATNDVPKGLTILQNIPLSGYPYPATLSGICFANATSPVGGG